MSFHGLIACFFFVLSNIPLSGCIAVYLSIQPLKDILVASVSCFLFLPVVAGVRRAIKPWSVLHFFWALLFLFP